MRDTETRALLLQQLGAAISDLSEECWHAGWLIGAEDAVPALCRRAISTGQAQPWGQGHLSPQDAHKLVALANEIGGWARLDDARDQYVLYEPAES